MLSFEAYNRVNGRDPEFMTLTHEVLSGHGMQHHGTLSGPAGVTNRGNFGASIDDGHMWRGKTTEPIKHKALAKDLEGIGWVPDGGHADMPSYTWQKFKHPEDYSTTLRINIGKNPVNDREAPDHDHYHSHAEVL